MKRSTQLDAIGTIAWIERTGGVNNYMGHRQLATFFDAEYARFRAILSELGLAK